MVRRRFITIKKNERARIKRIKKIKGIAQALAPSLSAAITALPSLAATITAYASGISAQANGYAR